MTENENEKMEFLRLGFKWMGVFAVSLVALVEIVIKGLHKVIVYDFNTPEFSEALIAGCKTVYLVQGLYTVLAGSMLTFMMFGERINDNDVSANANFDINPNDFTQANGLIIKGEKRRAFSILLCLGGLICVFVPLAFIPFAGFFINPKNRFKNYMIKFSESGFKCPNCKKSMEWKKLFPKGKGEKDDFHDGFPPVVECYFWCSHCNKKYRERRVKKKSIYVSLPFDK